MQRFAQTNVWVLCQGNTPGANKTWRSNIRTHLPSQDQGSLCISHMQDKRKLYTHKTTLARGIRDEWLTFVCLLLETNNRNRQYWCREQQEHYHYRNGYANYCNHSRDWKIKETENNKSWRIYTSTQFLVKNFYECQRKRILMLKHPDLYQKTMNAFSPKCARFNYSKIKDLLKC